MLYAILCYDSEAVVNSWTKDKDAEVMTQLGAVTGKLGRTEAARAGRAPDADHDGDDGAQGKAPLIIDGPFAETKEQLLGSTSSSARRSRPRSRPQTSWRARVARRVRSRFARCGSSTGKRRRVMTSPGSKAAMISARPQALGPRCAAALVHLLPLDLPATQQIAIALRITRQALLQHARAGARFDSDGHVVLLDDQDRTQCNAAMNRRGPRDVRQGGAPPSAVLPAAGSEQRARSDNLNSPPPPPRSSTYSHAPRSMDEVMSARRVLLVFGQILTRRSQ